MRTAKSDAPHQKELATLVAPSLQSFSDFLVWWSNETEKTEATRTVDLSPLSDQFREAAESVVVATGHYANQHAPRRVHATKVSVLTETIFADVEDRPEKLEEFLGYYDLTLESVAAQEWVADATFVHITHISIDKAREIIVLSRRINELNRRSVFATLRLSLFEHPADGYPEPENGHIDRRFRPSIFGDTPHQLFDKALQNIACPGLRHSELFIRTSLDDDDLWLPWAMGEFVKIARSVTQYPSRDNWCIGIPTQFLYYPLDLGRVDLTSMRMVMPGSKFNVSTSWDTIVKRSSWMLPESFSTNVERQMRHRGVDIRLAHNSRPCLVYVRRGGRLSAMTKFEHYRYEPFTADHIGNERAILEHAIALDARHYAASALEFRVDPPTPEARAVFDPDTGSLEITFNSEELIQAHDLEPSQLFVRLKCRTEGGEEILDYPFQSLYHADPSNWTGRALLMVLTKAEEDQVFGTWIRGTEPYLS